MLSFQEQGRTISIDDKPMVVCSSLLHESRCLVLYPIALNNNKNLFLAERGIDLPQLRFWIAFWEGGCRGRDDA